jgi:DNA-binding LytR/AlgR family response regulator
MMPEMTGIEVAEAVVGSDDPPAIVFITAHDDYAVRAFELGAVDYVVKPLSAASAAERIRTLVRRISRAVTRDEPTVAALREEVRRLVQQQSSPLSARLPVKDYDERTIRLVEVDDVTLAQRDGRRVILSTTEKRFATYYTVDRLEERLAPQGFVRASPSTLINARYIEHLIPNGDGSYDAVLRDAEGTVVPVSRSRAKQLLAALRV